MKRTLVSTIACIASVAALTTHAAAATAADGTPASAGTSAAPPATLAQALEQAWQRAPAARALPARREQAAADAQAAAAWTPAPPSVAVAHLNDRLNDGRGRREWEAEVSVPLWLPRQRDAERARAEADARRVDAAAALARLQLAGALRDTWWQLAAARDRTALAALRVEAARALHADVERRVRAGELARVDANVTLSEARQQEGELADAHRSERVAADALQALTGAPPPDALTPETPADPGAAPHAELAAADAARRSAQARLDVAARASRAAPEVALRWQRERDATGERAADAIGVRLAVPLASPPRLLRETAAQRAELAEADAQAALLRERVALDVEAARRELATVERQAAGAADRAALAADTLALLRKSFALGESDLATLLRARSADFDAQAEVRRLATARAAAVSRFNQALGVLP